MCYITAIISLASEVPVRAQQVPRRIRKNFTLCASRDTAVASRVQTAGYYELKSTQLKSTDPYRMTPVADTSYDAMIFYPDGFWVYGFYWRAEKTPGDIEKYLHDVHDGTGEWLNRREFFYKVRDWGLYKVSCDTITPQVIRSGGTRIPGHRWSAYEYKFLVRSDKRLELLKESVRIVSDPAEYDVAQLKQTLARRECLPATFVPFAHIPPSDSWLKKQAWIWCDAK